MTPQLPAAATSVGIWHVTHSIIQIEIKSSLLLLFHPCATDVRTLRTHQPPSSTTAVRARRLGGNACSTQHLSGRMMASSWQCLMGETALSIWQTAIYEWLVASFAPQWSATFGRMNNRLACWDGPTTASGEGRLTSTGLDVLTQHLR